MSNTILTPAAVTRKALSILHQKLNFIGNINRQYDSSFSESGAKIGDSLKIRLPNQYTVRTGAAIASNLDTVESSTTLQVATQKGVDTTFTTAELTLSMDDFASRILEPAMSVLAANLEADALTMALDVYNNVNNVGAALNMNKTLAARKALVDNLAPGSERSLLLNTQDNLDLVDALKGLFQDSTEIGKQYREGLVGRTAGFGSIYENTLLASQATGTAPSTTLYTTNGATATGATGIVVQTGTATFKKGDCITIASVNRCHPETKADTGVLQNFVVTADYAGGAGTVSISPPIYGPTSLGKQNVVALPTGTNAIVKVGGASAVYKPSLAFHKDAFTFATADLEDVSKYGAWGSRQSFDGISMRIARQYSISSDTIPCRIDVLYGFKTIRAELACRILSN